MCEPITAGMTMASLSTFGTMMSGMLSIMQGVSAASDAQKAQNAQIANIYAQQDANNKLLEMQYSQARQAQDEANTEAMVEETNAYRKARRDAARIRVATGEAGLGGILAQRLAENPFVQAGWETEKIETARENKISQSQYEKNVERQKATVPTTVLADSGAAGKLAGGVLAGLTKIGEAGYKQYSLTKTTK